MCLAKTSPADGKPQSGPSYAHSALNGSTYLIVHNDKYFEFPFIYVKVFEALDLVVVIDTGCGARNGKDGSPASQLKDYITGQVTDATTAHPSFVVICTHCHFDHIGGIEAFSESGAAVVASGNDRSFLDPRNRGKNSLCEAFGTKTPAYEITRYADDGELLLYKGENLGLRILHTPGHTPDSMAIYDEAEKWLFVGDTCYQRIATMPWGEKQDVPIILPLQGDWKDFMQSLRKLHQFAQAMSDREGLNGSNEKHIRLAAGHTTSQAPAVEFLSKLLQFCEDVAADKIPVLVSLPGDAVAPGGTLGDETFVWWQAEGRTDFGLMMPEKFQEHF